jgi:RNA polymerase sigma-70 factor (ECF subfamily)
MADTASTRPSLLLRIRDPGDRQAWNEFVEVYAPLVYGFLRRQGLQDADAADLTQETLHAVSAAAGRLDYDPSRGTFRGWLFTVVRNRLRNFLALQARQARPSGDTNAQRLLAAVPAREQDQAALWEQEYEARLFACAAERVRPTLQESTWRAFWLTAVEGKSGQEAADALGLTCAAVYLARRRVTARLKEEIHKLQDD